MSPLHAIRLPKCYRSLRNPFPDLTSTDTALIPGDFGLRHVAAHRPVDASWTGGVVAVGTDAEPVFPVPPQRDGTIRTSHASRLLVSATRRGFLERIESTGGRRAPIGYGSRVQATMNMYHRITIHLRQMKAASWVVASSPCGEEFLPPLACAFGIDLVMQVDADLTELCRIQF